MNCISDIRIRRKKFLDGLAANKEDIRIDLFQDFYPDKAHFIYELLQNAEDAEATDVTFHLSRRCLKVEHDGRSFNCEDLKGITGIGYSAKEKQPDKIGRFGIGFKAVYLYTELPRVWSGNYAFEISDMVLPSEISQDSTLGDRTRFEFPFNAGKKPPDMAFSEVREGLQEISSKTLLFLSNIKEIQWRIDGCRNGRLLRIPHSNHHIEIQRRLDGRAVESSHFLRFTEPIEGLGKQYVGIAFELRPRASDIRSVTQESVGKRYRIVSADRGTVAVYFTATKETSNLRFHLHAPFVPELSRSSIKDAPANQPLFQKLAKLSAQSLCNIRDLGMLDRDFLAVLPNSRDKIPSAYEPLRTAIVDAMNVQPLTPMQGGGHGPAFQLLQAEAGLKSLLDREDIGFLVNGEQDFLDWGVAATQKNSLVDRFLSDLGISNWGVEKFVQALEGGLSRRRRYCPKSGTWKQDPDQSFSDWISTKSANWHRDLYALLYRQIEARPNRFDDICVVRRSDGTYGTASESYFPTPEIRDDSIHPRVEESTYTAKGSKTAQKHAKAFLKGIGVREVGEREQVEAILKQRYLRRTQIPTEGEYEKDLKRFIALFQDQPRTYKLFSNYRVFKREDGQWACPGQVYLDSPYIDTGLRAFYPPLKNPKHRDRPIALAHKYQEMQISVESLVDFAKATGVQSSLSIEWQSTRSHPKRSSLYWDIDRNRARRMHTAIDKDWNIKGLRRRLKHPTESLARLIWKTMEDADHQKLTAQFQPNRQYSIREEPSTLVLLLRGRKWLPLENGVFVRPAEASRDMLPHGFPYDPGWVWLNAIEFGKDTKEQAEKRRKEQEAAKKLGFRNQAALADAREFAKLPPDIRKRALAEFTRPVDLPEHKPGNQARRASEVRKEAVNAPERTTEKRTRSVSVERDAVKREKTEPYLRDLYTNDDGDTVCQACKRRLPFKLADGSYFFESVELLSNLEKHHYQNYLALCPNHAAMFMYANESKDEMKEKLQSMDGNELEILLAGQPVSIYFTDTHVEDLKVVLAYESGK
ncbi:MAG: hypothetical protein OXI11_00940 [Gammaproteobacteria bacterium]|nr:hypothetical protein [Gammaproteobacteria bacterium]